MSMKRLWKASALCILIVILALRGSADAQDSEDWLILEATESGRPIIVRALSAVPDESIRKTMPWRLSVRWRYEQGKNGMPTEAAIRAARGIEDGLFEVLRERGAVGLPLVRTGNGVRHWYYYVQDPKVIQKSIRIFFEKRPDVFVSVKAKKDVEWSELREVISHVRQ